MTEIVLATTTVDETVEAVWLQTDFSAKRVCSRAIGMDAGFHGFEIAKSEVAIAIPTLACRVKDSRIGHERTKDVHPVARIRPVVTRRTTERVFVCRSAFQTRSN